MPSNLEHLVESLNMSNGLTSVFIEVLVISGSILAETNREKETVFWLGQRDHARNMLSTCHAMGVYCAIMEVSFTYCSKFLADLRLVEEFSVSISK